MIIHYGVAMNIVGKIFDVLVYGYFLLLPVARGFMLFII